MQVKRWIRSGKRKKIRHMLALLILPPSKVQSTTLPFLDIWLDCPILPPVCATNIFLLHSLVCSVTQYENMIQYGSLLLSCGSGSFGSFSHSKLVQGVDGECRGLGQAPSLLKAGRGWLSSPISYFLYPFWVHMDMHLPHCWHRSNKIHGQEWGLPGVRGKVPLLWGGLLHDSMHHAACTSMTWLYQCRLQGIGLVHEIYA